MSNNILEEEFLTELVELSSNIKEHRLEVLFQANYNFIREIINNIEEYLDIYGAGTIAYVVSYDLENLNKQILLKERDDEMIDLFDDIVERTTKYLMSHPAVIAKMFKEGKTVVSEKTLRDTIAKSPDLFV